MSSALYRLGRFCARRPFTVIGAWLAIAAIVITASTVGGADFDDSFVLPGSDSDKAAALLAEADRGDGGVTAQVVVTPLDPEADLASAENRSALAALGGNLDGLSDVVGRGETEISPDGRVGIVRLQYPAVDELTPAVLSDLKAAVDQEREGSPLQIEAGGDLFFLFEEPPTGAGEMIGIVVAVVILLIAFGSLVAMGLPIGLALFGLALGVSAMPLVALLIDIPRFAPQMAAMIGIGVGIDYALFMVVRHREFLARGLETTEAAGRASATAGRSVIFAGGVVVLSILGLGVAGVPFLTAAAVATSLIVLIMVLASITLLPAFLGLAGGWINRLGLPLPRRKNAGEEGAPWRAHGLRVARRPWVWGGAAVLVLLALAAPALDLKVGYFGDGTLTEERTERRAHDLVASGFGPGFNAPLIVAVDPAGDDGAALRLSEAIAADPGIAGVAGGEGDGVTAITAFPTSEPQMEETAATVSRLRGEVIPSVVGDDPARAHVGGQTASYGDVSDRVASRIAWFIGAVVGLAFLLLIVLFRSLLVPLKAAVLNMLSIGAAYGVLVMVFQWGWGASLIGLDGPAPILSFVPMFMFAVVFGLSMDYEVFLLSRIREAYAATGDNLESVVSGIASTARVITSAALIMVSVFLGFVLGSDPTTKMVGLGLATAIFVDATIVRMVLVPATMTLLGDANWWLPKWLDRLLPNVEAEHVPAPETGAAK